MQKVKCYCCDNLKNAEEVEKVITKESTYLLCGKCKLTYLKCISVLRVG